MSDTETLAEDEIAAAVEAEFNAEAEPEDEPTPDDGTSDGHEPETSDQEPESQAQIEKIGKQLDGLAKHVAKRMGDILGEDAQLYRPCMCGEFFQTPGWLPPIDPTPDAQAFMYHWMGQHAPSDYRADAFSKACQDCGGLGFVATGSQVIGQQQLPCVACNGLGWTPIGPQRGGAPGAALAVGAAPANGGEELSAEYAPPPDTPEIANLKAQGYTVIAPYRP